MFSSVSGLGRLLNSASASLSSQSAKAQRQYDSVTEETITHDLLYPEIESLYHHQHQAYPIKLGDPISVAAAARSADDRGGLNVQAPRDVRVLVTQQMNEVSRVLYDTHPPTPYSIRTMTPTTADASQQPKENRPGAALGDSSYLRKAHTTSYSRQTSLTQNVQPVLIPQTASFPPANDSGGLFGSSRHRGNTPKPATSDSESTHSKTSRGEREELEDLLNCIFGAPGFPSTSSIKIHVKRYRPQSSGISRPNSPEANDLQSPKPFSPRKTFLSSSTTAEALPNLSALLSTTKDPQAFRLSCSYILITKLFTIDSKSILQSQSKSGQYEQVDNGRHPQPETPRRYCDATAISGENQSKQIKSPTFAVALVVYLPSTLGSCESQSSKQACLVSDPGRRMVDSWSFDVAGKPGRPGRESDQHIDYVLCQWAILIRTLVNLEIIMSRRIVTLLRERYPPSATQARQIIQLESSALQRCSVVGNAVDICTKRVGLGLQIRPVSTGQDRWALWKGVARGIRKAAGCRESSHYLSNLLAAFLGTHNEWLNHLAPRWYRKQLLRRREEEYGEIEAVRRRTVIVSLDKVAARRMIFLLSIFLPTSSVALRHESLHKNRAAQSGNAYSASPPYGAPVSRRQSLRRTITSNTSTLPGSEPRDSVETDLCESPGHINTPHVRRASDTRSIRSIALPIASTGTRKSSINTTATVLPISQQAIPLFTSFSPETALGTSAEARPGSSGSMAALRLQHTLSRSESNEHSNSSTDSQGRCRWANTRSGFWSSRRGSSTENSDVMASSGEGLGISGIPQGVSIRDPVNKLSRMVQDVDISRTILEPPAHAVNESSQSVNEITPTPTVNLVSKTSPSSPIPRDSAPEPFPLMMSVSEKDGVIDVHYSPTATQSSLSPSTFTSSRHNRAAASSYDNRWTPCSPTPGLKVAQRPQLDSMVNVAGWLRAFHPDFALQAVRPYDALKEDIKQSMRTEPWPSIKNMQGRPPGEDGWIDVCTTLIADSATFAVTRLTLRRKNASSQHHQADALLGRRTGENTEELFIEEPIVDHDPILAEALERVLSHGSNSSNGPSRASSPPRSAPKSTEHSTPALGLSRNDCKRALFGALSRIAKSVAAEVDDDEAKANDGDDENPSTEHLPTSLLKQGVRRWMEEVKVRSS